MDLKPELSTGKNIKRMGVTFNGTQQSLIIINSYNVLGYSSLYPDSWCKILVIFS
jgi:hypothetical protein